jgi:hypothetical protein
LMRFANIRPRRRAVALVVAYTAPLQATIEAGVP